MRHDVSGPSSGEISLGEVFRRLAWGRVRFSNWNSGREVWVGSGKLKGSVPIRDGEGSMESEKIVGEIAGVRDLEARECELVSSRRSTPGVTLVKLREDPPGLCQAGKRSRAQENKKRMMGKRLERRTSKRRRTASDLNFCNGALDKREGAGTRYIKAKKKRIHAMKKEENAEEAGLTT